jgi:hypothetical protein
MKAAHSGLLMRSRSNSARPPRTVSMSRPSRCRGVGPCVAKGFETGLLAGDRRERVQPVACRSRQPVEPCHHQPPTGTDDHDCRVSTLSGHSIIGTRASMKRSFPE